MSTTQEARNAIDAAIDALRARRATTSDETEKETINEEIDHLEAQRDQLDENDLAGAARAVADATAAMESSVKAAQAGPFDSHLLALHDAIHGLQTTQQTMTASERLARTDSEHTPAAAQVLAPPPPGLPPVGKVINAQALAAEYQACFDACVPAADGKTSKIIQWYCDKLVKSRDIYAHAGADIGVPWYFTGVIHGLEGGFNFGTHLHNGDPLTARTVHVPKGRPSSGSPPFAWVDSAKDALTLENFANQADWGLPQVLFRLEAYNGFGYRRNGLRTPYLWSFSNLYVSGKYVADRVFDPNAVSSQCGAAVMLKQLLSNGVLHEQNGTLS